MYLCKVIWFNGISTLDGYLKSNPIYTNTRFLNELELICLHTAKWV